MGVTHRSAIGQGLTELPMSAQCRSTASSSWRSSEETKMFSGGGPAVNAANDCTDVALLTREVVVRDWDAAAIFFAFSS